MPAIFGGYLFVLAVAVAWQIYCERKRAVFPIGFGWFAVSVYCAVVVAIFAARRGTPALLLGAIIGYLLGTFSMVVLVAALSGTIHAYYRLRKKRLIGGTEQAGDAHAP